MKIGILLTGHIPPELGEDFGEYWLMFEKLLDGHGFEFTNYAVVDNEFPSSVHSEDGWLITGSKHGAYEDHVWIPPLEDFLRDAYAQDIPIIGICFGHQILAQALGGKVEKYQGGWDVGTTDYYLENEGIKSLVAMHQDQVVELPQEAEVIARNDFCEYAGLAYKGNALSFQPHPEFTPEFIKSLINIRAGTSFPQELADNALAELNPSPDSVQISLIMAKFFKEKRPFFTEK